MDLDKVAGVEGVLAVAGLAYRDGKLGPADAIAARHLFEQAAERGNAEGMNQVSGYCTTDS
jgi:hypothetical protein